MFNFNNLNENQVGLSLHERPAWMKKIPNPSCKEFDIQC